ncbi:hypothetical protein PENSPDRAFT_688733 [Peniophora sp. CONT]|nr:hypothetical protein PENSPDRAFT_688733 [Peniophora sp. CONT]
MATATQHSPVKRRPSFPDTVPKDSALFDDEISLLPSYSPREEYNPPQFSREYSPSVTGSAASPTETVFSNYTVSSEIEARLAWQAPYESASVLGRQLDERARTPSPTRFALTLHGSDSRRPSAADTALSVLTGEGTTTSDSSYTTNLSQVALVSEIYGHLGAYPTDKPLRGANRHLDAPPSMSRVKSQVSSLRTPTVEHVPPMPAAQIPEIIDTPVIVPFEGVPEVVRQNTRERGRESTTRRDKSQARKPHAEPPHYDAEAHKRYPKEVPTPPGEDRTWDTPPRSRTSSRGRHHPERRRQTPYIGELAPPPLPGRGLPDEKYGPHTALPSALTRHASENWSAKSARSRYESRTSAIDDLDVETPKASTFSYRTEASVYSTHSVALSMPRTPARPTPTMVASRSVPEVPQTRRHVPTPVFIPSPPSPARSDLSRTPSAKSTLSRAPSYKTLESNEQLRSASTRHLPFLNSSPKSAKGAIRDSWIDLKPDSDASMVESLQRKQNQDLPMTPAEREAFQNEALKRQKQSVNHLHLYSINDIKRMHKEGCLPDSLASSMGSPASASNVSLSSSASIRSNKSGKSVLERLRGRKESRLSPPS